VEQNWLAKDNKPVRIKVQLGNRQIGAIRLYETNTDTDLAVNDGGGSLTYDLPAGSSPADLSVTIVAASGDAPVSVSVSQDGKILPANNGVDPINGDGPYTSVPSGTAMKAVPLDFEIYVVRP
jgi:hypothetical protein